MIFCVSPVEKSHIDQLDGSESLSSSERLPIFYREYVLGIWVPQTLLLSLPLFTTGKGLFGPDVTETHGVVKPRSGKTNTQDWLVVYKPL